MPERIVRRLGAKQDAPVVAFNVAYRPWPQQARLAAQHRQRTFILPVARRFRARAGIQAPLYSSNDVERLQRGACATNVTLDANGGVRALAGDFITEGSIARRKHWIEEIVKLSGSFGADATRAAEELNAEYARDGEQCLLDHLRLCGTIPETYGHDSSEEKLYSKYTDAVLAVSFRHMGLKSTVLTERADAADVDCLAEGYSFVADAKAFRMSRTAKNQKDFKVEAMAGWKREKPYAAVICPIYHLPARHSQIYQQAGARGVAILTYSHLAVMCRYATESGTAKAEQLLFNVFKSVEAMAPSKDAALYWRAVNTTINDTCESIPALWEKEQAATGDAIETSRQEALALLATERSTVEAMSREDAVAALLRSHNIPGREAKAGSISDNGILGL